MIYCANVLLCKHKQIDQSEFVISISGTLCELPNGVSVIYTLPQSLFTDLCPDLPLLPLALNLVILAPWISTNRFCLSILVIKTGAGPFSFSPFFYQCRNRILPYPPIYTIQPSQIVFGRFGAQITFVIETNLINLLVFDSDYLCGKWC